MALIRKVRGHEPVIGENTFLAETAVILGDVTIGRDCSIWYNAVLRGDVNRIVIGDRVERARKDEARARHGDEQAA